MSFIDQTPDHWLALSHAQENIFSFRDEFQLFAATARIQSIQESGELGWTVMKFKFLEPFPNRFRMLAADIFQSLRNSLDLVTIYSAASLCGNKFDARKIRYPMKNDSSFRKNLSCFQPEFVDFLCSFAENPNLCPKIDLISELANASKHRNVVGITLVPSVAMQSRGSTTIKGPFQFGVDWNEQNGELTYAKLGPGGEMIGEGLEIRPSFAPVITSKSLIQNSDALSLFESSAQAVHEVLTQISNRLAV